MIEYATKQEQQEAEFPLVKEIQVPSWSQSLKQDIVYHVATGLIFGVGHFIGAFLMKKALG